MNRLEVERLVTASLRDIVGRYKLGGSSSPAFLIVPPSAPSGVVCSGLEVILERDPIIAEVIPTVGAKLMKAYWKLTLIQWDDSASSYSACRLLLMAFDSISFETTRKTDLTNEQTVCKIFDPQWSC